MLRPDNRMPLTVILLIGMLGCAYEPPELEFKEVPGVVGEVTARETKQPPQSLEQMKDQPLTIDQAVTLATEDLANRLGHTKFSVGEAIAVIWPDASAGCPSPGHNYPQVLTPGYLIVFTNSDETFRYTGSVRSTPKWCPASRFRPPLATNPDA